MDAYARITALREQVKRLAMLAEDMRKGVPVIMYDWAKIEREAKLVLNADKCASARQEAGL